MTSQTTFTSCMHDQMLESNRDDVKLEAMRCVTVMTAKGKLTVPRTLFPHIVKNVSSKNPELKKLIYLYLTNFADQEPDLALLPVATLQKSLKSPNPLIRSSALKVLTSMRLSILTAILMATLRNSVNDLSPYVRKTVAHAIIKIYRLEPELRSDLIEYIERLFNDKNSMVLSSAVASFEVVCPERLDLVHKHYRRFCFILADCNEWGQTLLLNLLVRYVIKTYQRVKSGDSSDYNPSEHDPKILLRSAKPLVHSNNSAVVMAVVKLYIAIANHNEVRSTITRPLIRLLYSHREMQLIVLKMIEDLTTIKEDSPVRNEVESDDDEDNNLDVIAQSTKQSQKEEEKEEIASMSALQGEQVQEFQAQPSQTITKDGYIPIDSENGLEHTSTKTDSKLEPDRALKEGDIGYKNIDDGDKDTVIVDREDAKISEIKSEVSVSGNGESGVTEDSEEDGEDEEEEEDDDDDDGEEEDGDSDEEEDEEDDSEDSDDDEDDDEADDEEDVSSESEKETEDKREINIDFIDLEANKDPNAYIEIFRPYIKSFFVKHTDCTQIRLVKLRILTNLSSSVNVTVVLRELQAYISTYVDDKEFISAAIHTIGRCAIIVKEVAHICLNRLTSLLSNNNEHIVSEAIVVLRSQIINKKSKKLPLDSTINGIEGEQRGTDEKLTEVKDDSLRAQSEESKAEDDKIASTVIKQVTRLLPTITAPQARATILWILAEFCDKNLTAAKCAPNVLRLVAKSFCQEDNFVKLQCLNLAAKFLLSLDKEKKADLYHRVHLLTGYLFSLAKYDINHDVRDRGRFLKKLLDDEDICSKVFNGLDYTSTAIAIQTV